MTEGEAASLLLKGFQSAIGHQGTVDALKTILVRFLGSEIESEKNMIEQITLARIEIKEPSEQVVFKLKARLPEGKVLSVEEIMSVGYEFWHVSIVNVKEIPACKNCENASIHARKHEHDDAYVSCRVHRLRDAIRSQFRRFENPAHLRADLKIIDASVADFSYIPNMPLDLARHPRVDPMSERVVIASFPGVETRNASAWPVITATIVNGEYDERRLGVLYCEDTGGDWTWLLDTEDQETAGLISLVVNMLDGQAKATDTCVHGKATSPEKTAPAFKQRVECDECKPKVA